MPYIPQSEYKRVSETELEKLNDPGEINYKLTVNELLDKVPKNYRYKDIHNAVKALMDLDDIDTAKILALLEFYRRLVAPYEDRKKQENLDVYSLKFPWLR